MLQHKYPGGLSLPWEHLVDYTRRVVTSNDYSGRIISHFECLKRAPISVAGKRNSNSVLGQLFQACVYDALISSGVDENRVSVNVNPRIKATADWGIDCDLVIRFDQPRFSSAPDAVVVFLKTSIRERWKQVDRDAFLVEMNKAFGNEVRQFLLTYKEHDGDDAARSMAAVIRRRPQFASRCKYMTVFCKNDISTLFGEIITWQSQSLAVTPATTLTLSAKPAPYTLDLDL